MKLSPSSAYRWMVCPGSVALADKAPRRETAYMSEGSAAHRLAETCLRQGVPASTYAGQKIVDPAGQWKHTATDEMVEAVQLYLDYVVGLQRQLPLATLSVEVKIDVSWLVPGLTGTADAVVAQPYGALHVIDYKHGEGVLVGAEGNPQASIYALGMAHGQDHDDVVVSIVQPRAAGEEKTKSWNTTPEALEAWAHTVLKPAAEAVLLPNAPLRTGSHCRFCPALATCPEARGKVLSTAMVPQTPEHLPVSAAPKLPAPASLSNEQLVAVHDVLPLLKRWADSVEEHLFSLVQAGATDLPYKIVAGRMTRGWLDDSEVVKRLAGKIPVYAQKLKSPKGIEDALREAGLDPATYMDGLVKESRKPTLAPLSDKRPAISGADAADVFTAVDDQQ